MYVKRLAYQPTVISLLPSLFGATIEEAHEYLNLFSSFISGGVKYVCNKILLADKKVFLLYAMKGKISA